MDIEERAGDGWIEVVRPIHRRFAEWGDRPRIDREGHVHHMGCVIGDGGDRRDLGEGPPLLTEIVDDPDLRRTQFGGRRGVARLEPNDSRWEFGLRKLRAIGAEHADRAEREQRPGIDIDGYRSDGAVAVALRAARKGRDVARQDAQTGAVDRDRDGGVVVSGAPHGVDDRAEIAFRAPGERVAIGRRVLPQFVERRSVLDGAFERPVAALDVDGDGVGDRRPRDGRGAFAPTPESEEVESLGAVPGAARDDGRRQRDNETHIHAIERQVTTIHSYAFPLIDQGHTTQPIVLDRTMLRVKSRDHRARHVEARRLAADRPGAPCDPGAVPITEATKRAA